MAGSNAVASGSAILTANADGLKTGLDKAQGDIVGWANKTQAAVAKTGGPLGKAGGDKGGGLLGMLGMGAGGAGGLATMATGVGAAAVAVGVFGAKVKGTLDDMGRMDAIAKAMGMTSEQFTGIAGVAKSVGEDTREFVESLVTLGKLGTDAAKGTPEASAAFQQLGLSAKDFIKLRPDEQFLQVFDSINKINDPLQRTRVLMQAFGEDGGKYLLPLLGKAPEDLRKMAAGFAVSGEEMKRAADASAAWKGLEASIDKVWQGIVSVLAKPMEWIANGVNKAVQFVRPLIDFVGGGMARVERAVSSMWDSVVGIASQLWDRIQPRVQPIFDWLEKAWDATKKMADIAWDGIVSLVVPVVEEIVTWVEQGIDLVADWTKEVLGFSGQWPDAEKVVVEAFRTMGTAGAYAWDSIRYGAGLVAIGIAKIISGLGDLADQFKGTLKGLAEAGADAANALGLTDTAKAFNDVAASTDKIGANLRGAAGQLEKWGNGQIADFGSTATQFNKWLDKALQPKKAGAKIAEGMAQGMAEDFTPIKLGGAITAGSKEAYSLIVKNQLRGIASQDQPIKSLVKEAKKGNDLQKQNNKQIQKIDDKLETISVI